MRLRTVISDVMFTVAGLSAAIGVHKYVFGDFPKLSFVRHWPWTYVNPWIAWGIALALAFVAA